MQARQSSPPRLKLAKPPLNASKACHADIIEWVKENAPNYNITGISLTVLVDSNSSCQLYYGYRNKAKKQVVTATTLFNAASISKPLSSLAALKIFEQYKLSVNESIDDYLVHWKLKAPTRFEPNKVTLVNLLSHSAGITGFRCKGYKQNKQTNSMVIELIQHYLKPKFSNNWGLGIQVNLNNNGNEVKQGNYFGHGGFNSGYLSFMLGHQKKPIGFAVLVNTAPLMTTKGSVVQFNFIKDLNKQIAHSYDWL